MSAVRWANAPPRREQRRALRAALSRLGRPLRVLAEDVSGLAGSIDLVAADPDGRVVVVLLVDGDQPGADLALVARGLAERAWLAPRLADWVKLAPDLGIRPTEAPRLLLVAREPSAAARLAAREADADDLVLARLRFASAGGAPAALLEVLDPPESAPAPVTRLRAAFRTGLSDELLGLDPSGSDA